MFTVGKNGRIRKSRSFMKANVFFFVCLWGLCLFSLNPALAQKKGVYDYKTGELLKEEEFKPNDANYDTDEPNVPRTFSFMVFEAGLNAGISTGFELREVFEFGNGVDFSLVFNPLKGNRLFVGPLMHFYYFTNYYDFATQDNLIWWGIGAKANYYLKDRSTSKWNFYPAAKVEYNRISNFLSPRPGYSGGTLDVLKGGGMSFALGAGVTRNLTFLQIDYFVFNPMTKVSDALKAQFATSTGLYEPYKFNKTRMGFNYLNLTIGIQLPVGKR